MRSSLYVLLFATLCAVLQMLWLRSAGIAVTWDFAVPIIWFTVITGLLLHWQEARVANDTKGFMRRFMAGLVIKLLVSMVVLFALLRFAPKDIAKPLAASFVALYFAFLIFSTARLSRLVKHAARA